jgi:hypothetical protein
VCRLPFTGTSEIDQEEKEPIGAIVKAAGQRVAGDRCRFTAISLLVQGP